MILNSHQTWSCFIHFLFVPHPLHAQNLTPKRRKWHFRGSTFEYFPSFLGLDIGNENHIGVLVINLCHHSPQMLDKICSVKYDSVIWPRVVGTMYAYEKCCIR